MVGAAAIVLTGLVLGAWIVGTGERRPARSGDAVNGPLMRLEPADSTATHGVAHVRRTVSVDGVRYGSQ
jgi:hypothetical protein